jgi:hypothetical protein
MMQVRVSRAGLFAMALVLAAAISAPVSAKSTINDAGSYDDPFTDTVCDGYAVEGRNWGHWQILDATAATNGQFFYFTNWYNGHTKITNPANGKSVTEDWHGVFKEVNAKAQRDNPNVFAFQTVDLATYTMKSARGRLLHAELDLIVISRVFDTLGDSQPGGQELQERELINTTDQTFDFCQVLDQAIG